MTVPQVVSSIQWLAARKELLRAEEQAAAALAEVQAKRQGLPAVIVGKEYARGIHRLAEMRHHDRYAHDVLS